MDQAASRIRGGSEDRLAPVVEIDDIKNCELPLCAAVDFHLRHMARAFSPRQTQIVSLIAVGYSDKEVAQALRVSTRTVRTQLERLFAAHGLHSRSQAVYLLTTVIQQPTSTADVG